MTDILYAVGQISGYLQQGVAPMLMVGVRLSLILFLMPALGMRMIPVRVKASLLLALSLLMLPTTGPVYSGLNQPFILILLQESVIGFYIGFVARTVIFVLSMVGTIVAQSLSLSQIFGAGISEEANTTVSSLLTLCGSVLFLTLGFHFAVLESFIASIRQFPPGALLSTDIAGLAGMALSLCGSALALALSLSAPFLAMNLMFNVLLGVLNKAMPQLMVTFVGLPAITLAGIVLLGLASAPLMQAWTVQSADLMGALLP